MRIEAQAGWRGARVAQQLAAAQAAAIARVNAAVGEARLRYITEIPGQQMLYARKEAEAIRYIADPDPDPAAYPLISAEVGITAPTPWQLAQIWLNAAAMLEETAAALERVRLGAIAAIEAAPDAAAVEAVLAGFSIPDPIDPTPTGES